MNRSITIITPEKNVSCLPGFESFDTISIAKRMPRRKLKSIKELKFEQDAKNGIYKYAS